MQWLALGVLLWRLRGTGICGGSKEHFLYEDPRTVKSLVVASEKPDLWDTVENKVGFEYGFFPPQLMRINSFSCGAGRWLGALWVDWCGACESGLVTGRTCCYKDRWPLFFLFSLHGMLTLVLASTSWSTASPPVEARKGMAWVPLDFHKLTSGVLVEQWKAS